MPFVTVDHFASVPVDQRRQLQQRLAAVVMETLNATPGYVRVYTRALDPADVYMGNGQTELALPIIRVEFVTGKTYEQKQALVHGLAHATADVLGLPVGQIRTILFDQPLTDWARGDKTMHDLQS